MIHRPHKTRLKRTEHPYLRGMQDFVIYRRRRNPFRVGTLQFAEYHEGYDEAERRAPELIDTPSDKEPKS